MLCREDAELRINPAYSETNMVYTLFCAESDLDLVFTVGNETVATHESIFSGSGHMHFSTKEDLIKELRTEIMDGDKILVKGSRGMAMETIIETLMK